jgi:hypothetical protein
MKPLWLRISLGRFSAGFVERDLRQLQADWIFQVRMVQHQQVRITQNKKALVTGASGFIGIQLIRFLQAEGLECGRHAQCAGHGSPDEIAESALRSM